MEYIKTVLITGASSGMGIEMAKLYKQMNYKVYACARRVEKMQVLNEIGCNVINLDLISESSIQSCIKEINDNNDQIDILVNNAGYGMYGPMENTPMENVRRIFEVNLFGLARITQMILPSMRERRSGTIVNISSMGGIFSIPFGGWYHGTKYALEAYSDSLRQEVARFGIKVIIIEPGLIQTEWGLIAADSVRSLVPENPYAESLEHYADYLDRNYRNSDKLTKPCDIAKSIVKVSLKKNPAVRYQFGKMSKLYILTKKVLPDKVFDFIVRIFI